MWHSGFHRDVPCCDIPCKEGGSFLSIEQDYSTTLKIFEHVNIFPLFLHNSWVRELAGCSELVCCALPFVGDNLHVIPVDHPPLSNNAVQQNPPISDGGRAWITLKGTYAYSYQVGDDLDNKSLDKRRSMDHKLMHPLQPQSRRLAATTDATLSTQGYTYKKARCQLNHKRLIHHNTDTFSPLPNKTAAPSTHHNIEMDKFDIMHAWSVVRLITLGFDASPLPTSASNSMTRNYLTITSITTQQPSCPIPRPQYWIWLRNTNRQLVTIEATWSP